MPAEPLRPRSGSPLPFALCSIYELFRGKGKENGNYRDYWGNIGVILDNVPPASFRRLVAPLSSTSKRAGL